MPSAMQLTINNAEFEKVLFAGLINDPAILGLLGNSFTKQLFTVEEFQKTSLFFYKFWNAYHTLPTPDEIRMYSKDSSFIDTVNKAKELVKNVNYEFVDRDIFFKSAEQYVKEKLALLLVKNIIDDAANKKEDALDATKLVAKFEKVAGFSMTHDLPFSLTEDCEKFIENSQVAESRLPTGIETIDNQCGGGILADGNFIGFVCAESNMGKSLLLGNIACNVARMGKKVLIISLEMSEMVYAKRLYSDLYDIDINVLHLSGDELREKISTYSSVGGIHVKEFPTASMTAEKMVTFLDKLYQRGERYDLICIDYLTLMAEPMAKNSYEKGQLLTQKCRGISYKFKCPVLSAAQLNRAGYNKEPENDNLSESMAIVHDSDFALGLYEQKNDAVQSLKSIKCMKSRISDRGWYGKLYYNKKFLRLESYQGTAEEDDKFGEFMDDLENDD